MLQKLEGRLAAEVRVNASKDFSNDFEALGEIIKGVFEDVRAKLGYSVSRDTPTGVVYEATGKHLSEVLTMIKTGKAPPVKVDGVIITVNEAVVNMATSYLDRAEEALADRFLRAFPDSDGGEPDPPPYRTNDPDLWIDFSEKVAEALGMTPHPLEFKCHSCGFNTEGYLILRHGVHFLYWRCCRPSCYFSGKITAQEICEVNGELIPAGRMLPFPPASAETPESRIIASLKSPVWSEYRLEAKYAGLGLKMMGFSLESLGSGFEHCAPLGSGFQYCSECGEPIEGYQIKGKYRAYIRWRCTNGGCLKSEAIQTEERSAVDGKPLEVTETDQ